MLEQGMKTARAVLLCMSSLVTACEIGAEAGTPDSGEATASEPEAILLDITRRALRGHRDINLPSNIRWNVYRSPGPGVATFLGKAQRVCLNSTSPTGCPARATEYGFAGEAWSAQLDACGGKARWIWAPGISGASAPAEYAEYFFSKRVYVPANSVAAFVHIAVDDFAEVIVNGTAVGAVGSTTDIDVAWASQSSPTAIDISSALVDGMNTITIRAANGTGEFASCTSCTYQQNPAAVVFCLDIRY